MSYSVYIETLGVCVKDNKNGEEIILKGNRRQNVMGGDTKLMMTSISHVRITFAKYEGKKITEN